MRKRFGRNQRRRMREELAALQMTNEALITGRDKAYREVGQLQSELRTWANDVIQLMGRDSAFNAQAQRLVVQDVNVFGGEVHLDQPVSLLPMSFNGAEPIPTRIQPRSVLKALIWRLRLSTDGLRNLVRIELENERRVPVGYVLGVDQRWTERDIHYVAGDIARKLIRYINEREQHD